MVVIGQTRLRALPLAAGRNEGDHYWSEPSACDQKSKLYLVFFFSLSFSFLLTTDFKVFFSIFFGNFEGYSADTCAEKFPLVSMWGRAEGLACADPGARTRPLKSFFGENCRQIRPKERVFISWSQPHELFHVGC
jgi:hypothetical protein